MTRRELREIMRTRLIGAGIEDVESEIFLLFAWKPGISRADYFTHPEAQVPREAWEEIDRVLKERERRVPLQYLMGTASFMGYSFYVDERVLTPRQDTECLVELAAEAIRKESGSRAPAVLDLCTGSGCIGISLKLLCPEIQCTLTDVSSDALCVAKKNAAALGASVSVLKSDLFALVPGTYDFIVSNPPYIRIDERETLMPEVRLYEPPEALYAREDGLYFYREITAQCGRFLRPGGRILFEIGQDQGEAVRALLEEAGFSSTEIKKDLAGQDRVVSGRWREEV